MIKILNKLFKTNEFKISEYELDIKEINEKLDDIIYLIDQL